MILMLTTHMNMKILNRNKTKSHYYVGLFYYTYLITFDILSKINEKHILYRLYNFTFNRNLLLYQLEFKLGKCP